MVHLRFSTLWTSNCLPILMRILNGVHFWLRIVYCAFRGWLISQSTYAVYQYLVHKVHRAFRFEWPLIWESWGRYQHHGPNGMIAKVNITASVVYLSPSRSTKWKTPTKTTANCSNSLQCVSLSSLFCGVLGGEHYFSYIWENPEQLYPLIEQFHWTIKNNMTHFPT